MNQSLNYDNTNIHKIYDISRSLPSETIDLWLNAIDHPIENILDLGCGTGRFTLPLSKKFNAKVIGIDPSQKMISVARNRDINEKFAYYQIGHAENIPLKDKSISLVFLSMAYHHLKDIDLAFKEIRLVLSEVGYCVIRNATKENIMENEMFNFFPSAKKLELKRMPSKDELIKIMENKAFNLVSVSEIKQLFANNYCEYFDKISKRSLSVFNKISDHEFESGLKRFKQYCGSKSAHQKIYEVFTLFIFRK